MSSVEVESVTGSIRIGPEGVARGNWGGKLEFLLTCVGFAVGLGNVWRFPYLCYRNGGGAFLIPYFIMLLLVGIPLFFLELAFGQFASLGPIAIWRVNPLMKGLGYTMVITNILVALYYNVIIAWCIHYFFSSMTLNLPWQNCNNAWNTVNCITGNITQNVSLIKEPKTASEEYFYNRVLNMSDGLENMGTIQWELLACLALSWFIVFLVLSKGISSLGKIVYFSSIFPYVLLTIMFIRGVTLEGAGLGIKFYLSPNFERLKDVHVWNEAATQIFYSLSACCGGLIAMSSYNEFKNNCLKDSIIVSMINCATSFYAGFAIFSVLGFMANAKGVSVDKVAAGGPGLVFVVYPEGITQMPFAPLWAVMFFFMLITLGFSSQFSMVECFFSSMIDEFPFIRRTKRRILLFRGLTCLFFFLITIPFVTNGGFYLLHLTDQSLGGFPLLVVGLFESVTICYFYGYDRFASDISLMLGHKPNIYFKFTWCFAVPSIMIAVIVFMGIQYTPVVFRADPLHPYYYPQWALALGWCIVALPIICIPVGVIYGWIKRGALQSLKDAGSPGSKWGPALEQNRTGRYEDEEKKCTGLENAGYETKF